MNSDDKTPPITSRNDGAGVIEIKYLADCRQHINSLAELWYESITRHWVSDSSIDQAKSKLLTHLNVDKLPLAMVAEQNGHPIGMACLRETDGIRLGVTPWLGSLVVKPDNRHAKTGETLIEAIKEQAKIFGYYTLYLLAFDRTIPNWYARLGWQTIGDDELFGHRVTVMSTPLC